MGRLGRSGQSAVRLEQGTRLDRQPSIHVRFQMSNGLVRKSERMVLGVISRIAVVIDRSGRQRFGGRVRLPGGVSKGLGTRDIGMRVGLRVVIEEEMRWIGSGLIGRKGDDAAGPWGIHRARVGKRGMAVVGGGSGRHGGGFGAVEDVVVKNGVGVWVERSLVGGRG